MATVRSPSCRRRHTCFQLRLNYHHVSIIYCPICGWHAPCTENSVQTRLQPSLFLETIYVLNPHRKPNFGTEGRAQSLSSVARVAMTLEENLYTTKPSFLPLSYASRFRDEAITGRRVLLHRWCGLRTLPRDLLWP